MSIPTVSQQFHIDIDNVSETHTMQNICVDIVSFTAVSHRYRWYLQYFRYSYKGKILVSITTVSQQFHVAIDDNDNVSLRDSYNPKYWCRYQQFHISFTSISSISTTTSVLDMNGKISSWMIYISKFISFFTDNCSDCVFFFMELLNGNWINYLYT